MQRLTRLLALVALSVGAALLTTRALAWLEQRRCSSAGGRWEPATGLCMLAPASGYSPLLDTPRARLIAALIAAALTVAVWAAYLRLRRRLATGGRQEE
jgi:hypothetical protein